MLSSSSTSLLDEVAHETLTRNPVQLCVVSRKGAMHAQEFKDASIVHYYKHKGNRYAYDNHRGIFLLFIAGKIVARIVVNRLIEHLD